VVPALLFSGLLTVENHKHKIPLFANRTKYQIPVKHTGILSYPPNITRYDQLPFSR
jgi:hypothetical protein